MLKILISILLCLISHPLIAEPLHYRNIIIGARAATMGGAYTAIADDASGPMYNPAGIAAITGNSLSMSSNAWQRDHSRYKEAINGEDFVQSSESLFPVFVGGTRRLWGVTLAYSLATSEIETINENNLFEDMATANSTTDTYLRTITSTSTMTQYGGALGFSVGDHLRFGLAGYFYQRRSLTQNYQLVQNTDNDFTSISLYRETKNDGVIPSFGVQAVFAHLTLGLSVRTGYTLSDHTQVVSTVVAKQSDTETIAVQELDSDLIPLRGFEEDHPMVIQTGIATRLGSFLLLAADASLTEAAPVLYPREGDFAKQPVVNWNIGAEWNIADIVKVRGGTFSNNTVAPPVRSDQQNQLAYLNYQGITAGLALRLDVVTITLGVVRQRGEGKSQLVADVDEVQTLQGQKDLLLFGTQFNY